MTQIRTQEQYALAVLAVGLEQTLRECDPFQDAVPCFQPRERYNFWCKACGGVRHGNPMDHLHAPINRPTF